MMAGDGRTFRRPSAPDRKDSTRTRPYLFLAVALLAATPPASAQANRGGRGDVGGEVSFPSAEAAVAALKAGVPGRQVVAGKWLAAQGPATAAQAVSAALPFTPGVAGAQQALLVKVFGGSSTVAAYSVGQQIAIAAFTFGVGFVALAAIFRVRSFREIIARGREQREEEQAARRAAAGSA